MTWCEQEDYQKVDPRAGSQTLVAVLSGVLPVYRLTCELIIYTVGQFSLVEKSILQYIKSVPCDSLHEISAFYALRDTMVEELVSNYAISKDIYQDDSGIFRVSPALETQLREDTYYVYKRVPREVFYCGKEKNWIGLSSDLIFSTLGAELDDPLIDNELLHRIVSDPVDENVFSCEAGGGKWLGLAVDALVVESDDKESWNWELFVKEYKLPHLKPFAVEKNVLEAIVDSLDTRAFDQNKIPSDQLAVQLVASSDNDKTVHKYDALRAREVLLESIRAAKLEIILWYPWIKQGAVTQDLLDSLRAAVNRGVRLYIFYGIGAREQDEDTHDTSIRKLQALSAKRPDNPVIVKWLGNSHRKESLIDRRILLSGSHNLLSYKGDMNRPHPDIRIETTHLFDGHDNLNKEFLSTVLSLVASHVTADYLSGESAEVRQQYFMLYPEGWNNYIDWELSGGDVAKVLLQIVYKVSQSPTESGHIALGKILERFFSEGGLCESFYDDESLKRKFFNCCRTVQCANIRANIPVWEAALAR